MVGKVFCVSDLAYCLCQVNYVIIDWALVRSLRQKTVNGLVLLILSVILMPVVYGQLGGWSVHKITANCADLI